MSLAWNRVNFPLTQSLKGLSVEREREEREQETPCQHCVLGHTQLALRVVLTQHLCKDSRLHSAPAAYVALFGAKTGVGKGDQVRMDLTALR